MPSTQRHSALLLVLGLAACSSSGGSPAYTGSAPPTAGTSAAAGNTSSSGGSASSPGGSASSNGGTAISGAGTASAAGGDLGSAGSAVISGGSSGTDGGMPGTAGTDASAGTGTGGGGGSMGAAGSPGVVAGIPAGYPAATAANAGMCKTVPMVTSAGGDKYCPGGGPGPNCMECLFGGDAYGTSETTPTAQGTMEAGNYVVTLKLGGAAAGQTFIAAESSRGLLHTTATTAGQSLDFAFVVNVRAMEGQPKHAGGPSGYPGLDLFFSSTASPPPVSAIGYALATTATKPIMVYVAGDSTVCDDTGNDYAGWAEMIPQYFAPPVGVANYANSGASSGSFPYWSDITSHWVAGDWVIIQFGHNDKTVTDAVVQANLEKFASDAIAANVHPIIVSPPARVQFGSATVDGPQDSLHPAAAKAAAAAKNIPFIDLTTLSTAWYNTLGSQAAAMKFHALGTDASHTNLAGADKIASLVAGAIKSQNIGLAPYLR